MKKYLATTALILTLASGGFAYALGDGKFHDGPPPHVKEALAKLPAEKAEKLASALKQMREGRKEQWQSMKPRFEELRAMLTAETFDKDAYLAKSREIDRERMNARAAQQERFATLIEGLDLQERQALADIFARKGHRGKHHRTEEKLD